MKCMEEASVMDVQTFKEILMDDTGSYPEESCLRKCLYLRLGLINDEGEVVVSFKRQKLQKEHGGIWNS